MRLREIMQISHERAQFSLWSNEPWTVLLYTVHSGRFKIGPFRKRLRTCSKNLCAMMINCHFASSFWDSLLTMLHGTHMYRYSCDSWLCANDLIIIQSGTHNTEWTRKSYLSSRKKTFSALCFWTSSHRIARYTHVSLFSYLLYDVILLLHSNTCDQGMRFTRVHTLAISNLPANKFVQSATVAKLVKNKIQVEISRQNLN
jgi:hypothetical protein